MKSINDLLEKSIEDENMTSAERRRMKRYFASRKRLSPVCTRVFELTLDLRDALDAAVDALSSPSGKRLESWPGEHESLSEDLSAFATVLNGFLLPLVDCQLPIDETVKLRRRR